MKSEFWIARDLPMRGATVGDLALYGREPHRLKDIGIFQPQDSPYEEMMFFECNDCIDMIILNPDAFPEITWENSPQKLTLTNLK